MTTHKYPLIYALANGTNIHVEHANNHITCIWFSNIENIQTSIPCEISVHESNSKTNDNIIPYRDTQTYALPRNGNYTIKYNNKAIINLETCIHPCIPPIVNNEIYILDS